MSQTSAAGPVGGLAAVMQNALDLLQPLFTKAPASYQARLIAQFAALFYLFATSLLFLVLYCIYSRRTNRGVWLIRLGSGSSSGDSRSTAEGKLLTINSLPITALLANLIAIAMTVNCWTNWQYFVGGADYRTNALITGFVPWTLVYLQAYAFSFNNLFATLTIRKRLRGLRVTRTNPWLYHTAMFSYPIIVIGTMLPIFIVANAWNNTALEAAWPMYQTIKAQLAALQSGQPVDLSAIVKLQQSYPALLVLANKLLTLLRVLCALNITYASIIVFMHIYSLLLVFSLRSHVKTVRQISATATAAETSLSHHTDSNISRRLSFTPRAVSAGNQQDIALQRLTSDLTYSIPLSILLLLSLIATTCCILATNFGSSNWVVSEFIRDGFMWMYVGVSDVVATVFVVNLIRAWITENRLQSSTPGCASATQNLSIERSSVAPQYNVKFAAADEEKGENVTGDLGECDGRVNLNMRLENALNCRQNVRVKHIANTSVSGMLGRRMLRPKRDLCSLITQQRFASSPAADAGCRVRPRRGLLYVPGSDEKKLRKSFGLDVDALCFDLEDSVTADRKAGARETVLYALGAAGGNAEKLVRINSNGSGMANDDLEIVLGSPKLQGIVIPKVHSAEDVIKVHEMVEKHAHREAKDSIKLIASIESAKAIMNLKEIANASPRVESLLFAAEDFCADTGITRSKDRRELLYARSAVVLAAKAYGLGAIDLVCIHYQDKETLQDECDEGRKLGFTAKQIIHPGQIETIQKTYSPSTEDIEKAKRILENYEAAVKTGKGAYGLGGEMIDAPMILQAESVLAKARSYGLS